MCGTTRALLAHLDTGETTRLTRQLEYDGDGDRAAVQGQKLNLTLGFSHPVEYPVPKGITIKTPSQNEILIEGMDRQQVGQVAAELRGFRPPEPYKGKGVRYSDEQIVLKEAKKK
jgi:large subunit ribosomal protein L6